MNTYLCMLLYDLKGDLERRGFQCTVTAPNHLSGGQAAIEALRAELVAKKAKQQQFDLYQITITAKD